ncbi:MAG: hypothetical protein ACRC33_29890 [Gemmataceae bacterium]
MAFSDFTLRAALEAFALTEERDTDLFAGVPPLEPSASLRAWLDRFAPIAVGVNSELARSTFIIAPVLGEASQRSAGPMTVMPGVTLDVDRGRGLNGFCDYVVTRSPEFYFLRGPVFAVVEAKREDLVSGLGQCAASMVGLREFNDRDGTPVPAVYGAVTSGTNWRFLRLAGATLTVDRREYYLGEVGAILGVLVHVAAG